MLTLTDKEKQAISQTVKDNFHEYYSKYSSLKYPEQPYVEWKNIFPVPKNVNPEHIKQALEWKYGHWGKRNYVRAHKEIISKIQKNWGDFLELNNYEIESAFSFWHQKLIAHQNFITIAFIIHLIHNSTIEIIDQHNFRAMNYLLASVRPSWNWKKKPSDIEDIRDYSNFFGTLLPLLDLSGDVKRKLDKFLMMFGKYKARNIDKSKIKKITRGKSVKFDWEPLNSDIFDLAKIHHRANADVLFVCLLLSLERDYEEDIPETITVRDISNRIPIGTAGISNYSSYNYAMIALFSGQKERDYFLFEYPHIRSRFTEQANNPLRNNNFWKEYMDESLTINPKYIL
ncbi:MAG: hypothetical protein ACTSRS_22350 [Candidatus Helarchaeota archaeon]